MATGTEGGGGPRAPVRVAVGQFAPAAGEPGRNLRAVDRLVDRAARGGARLLVLPEFSVSGYETGWVAAGAPGGASPVPEVFAGLARRWRGLGTAVVVGELERAEGGHLFSTCAVLAAGEVAAVHRKTVVTRREARAGLRPGDRAAVPVTVPGVALPVGPLMCFEHGFPEIALDLALAGAGLLTVSSLIGRGSEYLRELRTRARAQDNGAYVLAANAAGGPWCGASMIVDPRGEVVARAGTGTEEVVFTDADPGAVARERAAEPVLGLRRPELRPRLRAADPGGPAGGGQS